MSIKLRQSTASQEVPLGYFVDNGDGDTEETALTIANTDIKLWKNGATALASKNSGGATHMSNGIYYAVLDATDTNTVGPLVLFVHVSGALPARLECEVLPENVYDARYGSDLLQVDVTQVGGSAVAGVSDFKADVSSLATSAEITVLNDLSSAEVETAIGAALATYDPPTKAEMDASFAALNDFDPTTQTVDVGAISGDSAAADNLEAMLDGTGATVTLNKLNILANDAEAAIKITNAHADGDGVKVLVNSQSGAALNILNTSPWGNAVSAYGGYAGLSVSGDNFGLLLSSAIGDIYLSGDGIIHGSLSGNAGGIDGMIQTLDALDTAQDVQHAATQALLAALNDPTAIEVADALLTRDWTAVSGEAARSVLNALRSLRNKVATDATTLTVYEEDDATPAWSAALTTSGSAEPITEVDPA